MKASHRGAAIPPPQKLSFVQQGLPGIVVTMEYMGTKIVCTGKASLGWYRIRVQAD